MQKSSVMKLFAVGVALILLALAMGPTTTATGTECIDYTNTCWEVEYQEPNPAYWWLMGIGGFIAGPSFWWLVISSAVSSGVE